MTDPSPDAPADPFAPTDQDQVDAAVQERLAEADALLTYYRQRAVALNLEVRARDKRLAASDGGASVQKNDT